MTIQRMDHVGIVVDDLAAAIAFFVELGLELEGKTRAEGRWVDRIVGLEGVQADIVMMRTPDGHGRLKLAKFHAPRLEAVTPGLRRTRSASVMSRSRYSASTMFFTACGLTAPNSSASSSNTRKATGFATSAALRGSSSSWRSRSGDRSVNDQAPG
jgi:hypothetical protein